MGIGPTYSAWKADALPLSYTRAHKQKATSHLQQRHNKTSTAAVVWRPEPESNRPPRICNPLHNRSAIRPHPNKMQSKVALDKSQ